MVSWKMALAGMVLAAGAVLSTGPALADSGAIKFLIPGDTGSGWDHAARSVGAAMVSSGILKQATYDNLVGAGGGRALIALSEGGPKMAGTMMIQSAAMTIRSISGEFTKSYRDVVPVMSLFAEYEAVVVAPNSPIKTLGDLLAELKAHPDEAVAGGSSKWSLDKILAAKIYQAAGHDAKDLRFVPHDSDQKAIADLIKGQAEGKVAALVSGVGDVMDDVKGGKVRLIAVSSSHRLPGLDAGTLKEQGMDVVLANWRGFFVAPDTPAATVAADEKMLMAVAKTDAWKKSLADNAWDPFILDGAAFKSFLDKQDAETKTLLAGQ